MSGSDPESGSLPAALADNTSSTDEDETNTLPHQDDTEPPKPSSSTDGNNDYDEPVRESNLTGNGSGGEEGNAEEENSSASESDSDSSNDSSSDEERDGEGLPPMKAEDGHQLSEYEMLRLERIKRNREYLSQLGLEGKDGKGVLGGKPVAKRKKKKKPVQTEPVEKRSRLSRRSKQTVNYAEASASITELVKKESATKKESTKRKKPRGDKKSRGPNERAPLFIYKEFNGLKKHGRIILQQAKRDLRAAEKEFNFWQRRADIFMKQEQKRLEMEMREEQKRLEMEQRRLAIERIVQEQQEERKEFGGTLTELLEEVDTSILETIGAVVRYDTEVQEEKRKWEENFKRQEAEAKAEAKMKTLDALQRFPQAMKNAVSSLNSTLLERAPRDPPPPRRSKRAATGEDPPKPRPKKKSKSDPLKAAVKEDPQGATEHDPWQNFPASQEALPHDDDSPDKDEQEGKRKRKHIRNVGGWVSPAFAKKISRSWLEKNDPQPNFSLSAFVPQIGDIILYYPSGHRAYLEAFPDFLGKKCRISSRVPLWEKALIEKEKERAKAETSSSLRWWSENWLSRLETDLGNYPLVCRVERTHAEFPPDTSSKIVKKDEGSGPVQVYWEGPKRMPRPKASRSHRLRLSVLLRPLTPLVPPSSSDSLSLPPSFTVVTFPSSLRPFIVPFAWAYSITHSLDLNQPVSVRSVDGSTAHIRSFFTLGGGLGSFRLDDKAYAVERILAKFGAFRTDQFALTEALGDFPQVIPMADSFAVLETLKRFSERRPRPDELCRAPLQGGPIDLFDFIRSTLPLWDSVSIMRDVYDRKTSTVSPWDIFPVSKPGLDEVDSLAETSRSLDEALSSKIDVVIEDFITKEGVEAHFFYYPVTDDVAPSYSCAVPVGMCFSKILRRLRGNKASRRRCYYRGVGALLSDVSSILDNCLLYNNPDCDLVRTAQRIIFSLKQEITKVTKQHFREVDQAKKEDEERRRRVLAYCSAGPDPSQSGKGGAAALTVTTNTLKAPFKDPLYRDWLQQTGEDLGAGRTSHQTAWVPQAGDRVLYSWKLHAEFVKGHYQSLEEDHCKITRFQETRVARQASTEFVCGYKGDGAVGFEASGLQVGRVSDDLPKVLHDVSGKKQNILAVRGERANAKEWAVGDARKEGGKMNSGGDHVDESFFMERSNGHGEDFQSAPQEALTPQNDGEGGIESAILAVAYEQALLSPPNDQDNAVVSLEPFLHDGSGLPGEGKGGLERRCGMGNVSESQSVFFEGFSGPNDPNNAVVSLQHPPPDGAVDWPGHGTKESFGEILCRSDARAESALTESKDRFLKAGETFQDCTGRLAAELGEGNEDQKPAEKDSLSLRNGLFDGGREENSHFTATFPTTGDRVLDVGQSVLDCQTTSVGSNNLNDVAYRASEDALFSDCAVNMPSRIFGNEDHPVEREKVEEPRNGLSHVSAGRAHRDPNFFGKNDGLVSTRECSETNGQRCSANSEKPNAVASSKAEGNQSSDLAPGTTQVVANEDNSFRDCSPEDRGKNTDAMQRDWVLGTIIWVRASFPKPLPKKNAEDDGKTFASSSPLLALGVEFKPFESEPPRVSVIHWRPCLFGFEAEAEDSEACPSCGLSCRSSFLRPEWYAMAESGRKTVQRGTGTVTGEEIEAIDRCFSLLKKRCLREIPPSYVEPNLTKPNVKRGYLPSPTQIGRKSLPSFWEVLRTTSGSMETRGASVKSIKSTKLHGDDKSVQLLVQCGFLPPWVSITSEAASDEAQLPSPDTILPWPNLCLELVQMRLKNGYYRQRAAIENDILEGFVAVVFLLLAEAAGRRKEPISIKRIVRSLSSSKGKRGGPKEAASAEPENQNPVLEEEARWAERLRHIRELYATALVSVSDTAHVQRMLGLIKISLPVASSFTMPNPDPARTEARRRLAHIAAAFGKDTHCNKFKWADPVNPLLPAGRLKVVCNMDCDPSEQEDDWLARNRIVAASHAYAARDGMLVKLKILCEGEVVHGSVAATELEPASRPDDRLAPTFQNDFGSQQLLTPIFFGSHVYEKNEPLMKILFGRPRRMKACGRCQALKLSVLQCRLQRRHSNIDFDWKTDFDGLGTIKRLLDVLHPSLYTAKGIPSHSKTQAAPSSADSMLVSLGQASTERMLPNGLSLSDTTSLNHSLVKTQAKQSDPGESKVSANVSKEGPEGPRTEKIEEMVKDPRELLEKAKSALFLAKEVLQNAQIFSSAPIRLSKAFVEKEFPVDPEDGHYIYCIICGLSGNLLCCDGCSNVVHSSCVSLSEIPDGDWFCEECLSKQDNLRTSGNDQTVKTDCEPKATSAGILVEDNDLHSPEKTVAGSKSDASGPWVQNKVTCISDDRTPRNSGGTLPFGRVEFDHERARKLTALLGDLRSSRLERSTQKAGIVGKAPGGDAIDSSTDVAKVVVESQNPTCSNETPKNCDTPKDPYARPQPELTKLPVVDKQEDLPEIVPTPKRGRPRKHPLQENKPPSNVNANEIKVTGISENSVSIPKRRRGRPRKNPLPEITQNGAKTSLDKSTEIPNDMPSGEASNVSSHGLLSQGSFGATSGDDSSSFSPEDIVMPPSQRGISQRSFASASGLPKGEASIGKRLGEGSTERKFRAGLIDSACKKAYDSEVSKGHSDDNEVFSLDSHDSAPRKKRRRRPPRRFVNEAFSPRGSRSTVSSKEMESKANAKRKRLKHPVDTDESVEIHSLTSQSSVPRSISRPPRRVFVSHHGEGLENAAMRELPTIGTPERQEWLDFD